MQLQAAQGRDGYKKSHIPSADKGRCSLIMKETKEKDKRKKTKDKRKNKREKDGYLQKRIPIFLFTAKNQNEQNEGYFLYSR